MTMRIPQRRQRHSFCVIIMMSQEEASWGKRWSLDACPVVARQELAQASAEEPCPAQVRGLAGE